MVKGYVTAKNPIIKKLDDYFRMNRPVYLLYLSSDMFEEFNYSGTIAKDSSDNSYAIINPEMDVEEKDFLNRDNIDITFEIYEVMYNGMKICKLYFGKDDIVEHVKGEVDGVHEA